MAIVYSYPKVTSPLATDVLVITDTTVTAGKRKNKTKSIAMSDVATYIINSKSGITGTGTVNKFPIFTASTVVGDSIITQAALGQGITIGGNLDVTNDTNLQGSLLAGSLEVTNDSVFTGSARFNGTIKDTSGGVGTNGQVLTSTGTGVAWATDAGGSVTGTGTTNYIAKWNTSSSIQDSIIFDNGTNVGIGTSSPNSSVRLQVQETGSNAYIRIVETGNTGLDIGQETNGNGIINLRDNKDLRLFTNGAETVRIKNTGNVGIGTTSPQAKLHVNGQTAFLVTDGNETGLEINNGSYIYKIGDISGGENQAYMQIDSAASKAFFLNSNVGIGTNSPTQKLDVRGNVHIEASNPFIKLKNTAGFAQDYSITNDGDLVIEKNGVNGGGKFIIKDENDLTPFTTSFDLNSPDVVISGDLIAKDKTGTTQNFVVKENNGYVGIGTTSPVTKLHVFGSSAGQGNARIENSVHVSRLELKSVSQTGTVAMDSVGGYASGGGLIIDSGTNTRTQFLQGGANKMIIKDGNVGIGTTSPTRALDVSKSGSTILANFKNTGGTSSFISLGNTSSTADQIRLGSNGTALTLSTNYAERMRIDSSGRVLINATSTAFSDKLYMNNDAYTTGGWRVGTSSTYVGKLYNSSGKLTLESDGSRDIQFGSSTDGTKMYIDTSAGNVGIGTTNPSFALEVNSSSTSGVMSVKNSSNGRDTFRSENAAGTRTVNIGNDVNGHGLLLLRGAGGTTTSYLTGAGNSYFNGGRVGIGTTTPDRLFEVYGASDGYMKIDGGRAGNHGFTIGSDSLGFIVYDDTLTTYRLVIDQDTGNVGIGTTDPQSKLEVDGGDIEIDDSASGLILRSPNGTRYRIQVDNSGNLTTTAV